jgi:hypothetical protein
MSVWAVTKCTPFYKRLLAFEIAPPPRPANFPWSRGRDHAHATTISYGRPGLTHVGEEIVAPT